MLLRQKPKPRPAGAAVELAVLLPFLMFVGVIATDWARLLYYTIAIEACARNGALYASDKEMADRSPYPNVAEAALAEAPGVMESATVSYTLTIGSTTSTHYFTPNGEWRASVFSTTTTDSTGAAAVVVDVKLRFKTITNFPGVPSPEWLSRSVQMRVAPLLTRAP